MAVQGGNLRLYVMVLVLTLVFPVLGFTFTNFPDEMTTYDISLDAESLVKAGITLTDAETHNVSWKGAYVYYSVGNKSLRVIWKDHGVILGHGMIIERKGWLGWLNPDHQILVSASTGSKNRMVFNSTIVAEWNTEYNWTWFKSEEGLNVFIQPYNSSINIYNATFDEGNLNVTLGYALGMEEGWNFMTFLNWYMSLLISGESFGLPPVFTWILRVVSAISLLSAILLVKDLTRI